MEGHWGWGGQLWDFCEKKMLNQGKGSLPDPLPTAPEMLSVFSGRQEQTGNWESSVNYGRQDRLSVLGGRLTKEHVACVTWILLPTISLLPEGRDHPLDWVVVGLFVIVFAMQLGFFFFW